MPLTKKDLLPKYTPLTKVVIIGKNHTESGIRRALENEMIRAKYGPDTQIYLEYEFPSGLVNQQGNPIMGDPVESRLRYIARKIMENLFDVGEHCDENTETPYPLDQLAPLDKINYDFQFLEDGITAAANNKPLAELPADLTMDICHYQVENNELFMDLSKNYLPELKVTLVDINTQVEQQVPSRLIIKNLDLLLFQTKQLDEQLAGYPYPMDKIQGELSKINTNRERYMILAANRNTDKGQFAVWKIGDQHLKNMFDDKNPNFQLPKNFEIQCKDSFNQELRQYGINKNLRRNQGNSKLSTLKAKFKKMKIGKN